MIYLVTEFLYNYKFFTLENEKLFFKYASKIAIDIMAQLFKLADQRETIRTELNSQSPSFLCLIQFIYL